MNFKNCETCILKFNDHTALENHMKQVHGEPHNETGERKANNALKSAHLQQNNDEIKPGEILPRNLKCENCDYNTEDGAALDNHMNEYHWEDVEDVEDVVDVKMYKIKHYPNSDGDQMGLTIKGRTKAHIESHKKLTEVMNRLPKGKVNMFNDSKITVLSKEPTTGRINLKLKISAPGKSEGTTELNLFKPSVGSKKGATIEIRKTNEGDFENVQHLKDVIIKLLDLLVSGETVSKILVATRRKVTSPNKPIVSFKLLSCNLCDFKTKTNVSLKTHITRLHNPSVEKIQSKQEKCDMCGFDSDPSDMKNHKEEFHLVHQNLKLQSKGNNLKRDRSIKSTKDTSPSTNPPKKETND